MKIARPTVALNLLVVTFFIHALRITFQYHEVEHVLNKNEKKMQSYTRPNASKEPKKLARITLASEETATSTEKQGFRKHVGDRFTPNKHITERTKGSLLTRNKFLQRRNRREVNATVSKISTTGYSRIGYADKLYSVNTNRTQDDTNTLNNTMHSTFITPSTKPVTKTKSSILAAIKAQVSCESSWLSCRGRCVKGQDLGQTHDRYLDCFCDELCEIFFDCCYDYGHQCRNIFGHKYPARNVNVRSNVSNTSTNVWGCVPPPPKRASSGRMAGVRMITDCPSNWTNTSVREKCNLDSPLSFSNYEVNIPVIAHDGKTYKNRFCSICHGIPEEKITNFPLEMSCDILPPSGFTNDKIMQFLFSFCSISLNPPTGQQRRYCSSNVIDSCPNFAPVALQNNCKYGLTGIVSSGYESYYSNYRNVYCAKCHYAKSLVCGPLDANEELEGSTITPKLKPFSLIVDLGFSSSKTQSLVKRYKTRVFCPIGEVYDPHLEFCRAGIENAPSQTNFDKYRVSAWLKNTTKISSWLPATNNISSKARKEGFFLSGFKTLLPLDRFLVSNVKVEVEGKIYRVVFDIETRQYMYNTNETARRTTNSQLSLNNLLDFTKPTNVFIHSTNFTIIKATTRRLSCVYLQRFFRREYVVLSEPEEAVYVNKTSQTFKRQDYYLSINNNDSIYTITVCRRRLSFSCNTTYTKLSSNEIIEMSNKSVLWKTRGWVYNEGFYEKRNGTIWVCTNFSSTGIKETLFEQTNFELVLITILGLSFSVVLLSALLITYSLISELRTLPGINLMNLSFSLMLGHLLWLLGSGVTVDKKGCIAIALAIHFAFLSSFVWMTIIAIDTWRAFSKKGQRINHMSNHSKRKRYLRSMAIGWLSPLVFCGICFTLDQTNTVAIGYGGTEACWLQNASSRLYFFAVPMGILLLINIVFFILTVKAIGETVLNAQMATTENSRRKSLGVYMRIAALMGFTWLFGFLSSLHLYLSYVFVISCTLQGVYIAVAFLFTKRIARLIVELVRKNHTSLQTVSGTAIVSRSDSPRVPNTAVHKVRQMKVDFHSLQYVSEGDKENVECQDTCL